MTVNIGAIMRAKDGKSDELRKALHSLVNPTRAESGCIAYNLYKLKKVHSFV